MSASPEMEKKLPSDTTYPVKDEVVEGVEVGTISQIIYIEPEKEKAAFRKFDRYVVPASFVFIVLCALDRNNVRKINFSATIQN